MPWPPVGIAPSPPATLTGDFAAPDPTTLRAREDRDRGEARLVLRPLPLPCPRDRQASRLLSFSLTHRSPTAGRIITTSCGIVDRRHSCHHLPLAWPGRDIAAQTLPYRDAKRSYLRPALLSQEASHARALDCCSAPSRRDETDEDWARLQYTTIRQNRSETGWSEEVPDCRVTRPV